MPRRLRTWSRRLGHASWRVSSRTWIGLAATASCSGSRCTGSTTWRRLPQAHEVVCALGTTARRGFIEQVEELGFAFATVVHPAATIAPSANLGAGTIAAPGVVVGAAAKIGDHVILNRGVLVGHHTTIGRFVTVSPGANVAGKVSVGDGAYIGMGATVLDRISVGDGAVIGAGAVVTRDVPHNTQVLGVPARPVKVGVEGR